MKSLVLAEKPSVGKDLARVLGCRRGGRGYLEGPEYVVTWAMGHLVELADPGTYDSRYKTWKLEDLPILPKKMKFKVIKRTSRQFYLIKSLMKRSDIGLLIIATDAGREGELVARLIMKLASWKGPFKRLWISSQTSKAIKEGFGSLKDGHAYDGLYEAALCRGEADWIVGLNVTRALSCKYDVRLSAGRVQTPTLAIIALREKERENFTGKKYWTVKGLFGKFYGVWRSPEGAARLFSREEAVKVAEAASNGEGFVTGLKKTVKNIPPPLAYDLTALQREANIRLGFSAKKTLSTLQSLYERHKIATYPRTDSRYITADMVPTLPGRLTSLKHTSFWPAAQKLLTQPLAPGKRFVNDAKVTEHHAVIPTGDPVLPENLDSDERKLMNLVIQRFLEVLSSPLVKEQSVIRIKVRSETFTARGERVIKRGWSSISGEGEQDSDGEDIEDIPYQMTTFPPEGSHVKVIEIKVHEEITKPPSRYTEGTLLGVMENPARFISNTALRASIASGGLGTPATRADIIEKILSNNYIEREGKALRPTSRGMELLALVPEELTLPVLTARWEQRLARIAEGSEKSSLFLSEIRDKTVHLVREIRESTKKYTPVLSGGKKCPLCGRPMLERKDKHGRAVFACFALSCGYEEPVDTGSGFSRPPGRKEKALNRKLISRYSDHSESTSSFGDLVKAAEKRKKK